jgi:transcriptional regulator with XRE-family HTH domain
MVSLYLRPGDVSAKPLGIATESFGRRVAKRRAELGWTQARLAERIGMSRVALSHVEANLSVPSERTVTLLAGVFAQEPHELADGTDYPEAKGERLPVVAARYTEADHQLSILAAVLDLLERVPAVPGRERLVSDVQDEWRTRLGQLFDVTLDSEERHRLRSAIRGLVPDG